MSIPDSVTALAQARMDARAAKDFALADKYRDELLQAGFEVVDVAGGYELKPKKPYITPVSYTHLTLPTKRIV